MRDNFSVEYGKQPVSRSGDGAENCPQSKWAYFKQLLFLKDVVTPRATSGSLRSLLATPPVETVVDDTCRPTIAIDVAEEPSTQEVFSQDASLEAWDARNQSEYPTDTHVSQESQEGLNACITSSSLSEAHPDPKPRKRKQPGQEQFYQTLIELEKQKVVYLNNKQSKKTQEGEDTDLMFFKTLLPHVKLIPTHKKLRFQSRIQAVVDEFAYPEQRQLDEEIYSTRKEPTHAYQTYSTIPSTSSAVHLHSPPALEPAHQQPLQRPW